MADHTRAVRASRASRDDNVSSMHVPKGMEAQEAEASKEKALRERARLL